MLKSFYWALRQSESTLPVLIFSKDRMNVKIDQIERALHRCS